MKKVILILYLFSCYTINIYCQIQEKSKAWNYPFIKPDTAKDFYFGKKVIDPFRNIENFENNQIKSWIYGQNKLFDTIINNIAFHDTLRKEAKEIMKKRKRWAGFPRVIGNRAFYTIGNMNDNDIERLVHSDSLNENPIELFNTKELNERDSAIYNFNYYEPSWDRKYIAFGISPNGTEMASIFIIDVEKKLLLPDKIERSKEGNIQWLPDNSGFFYVQEKNILTEEDKKTSYEDSKAMLHKLHTDSKNDKIILSRLIRNDIRIEKIEWPQIFVFPSSDKVLMNITDGSNISIYYAKLNDVLSNPGNLIKWGKICNKNDKVTYNVLYGNQFFALSFKDNPSGQIITMNLKDLKKHVIYDADSVSFDDMVLNKNYLYITSIKNGYSLLMRIDPKNFQKEKIELPFQGGINIKPDFEAITSYQHTDNFWFCLSGYNYQMASYNCLNNKNIIKVNIYSNIQYYNPPLELIAEEIEVPSYDGAMVPLSIVYRKNTKFDGNNPAFIEAYGAYCVVNKPEFNRNRQIWYNHGGIFALAHVRGGGEKGDNWYKGGFKATKANSWKDLIACAEYLIKNKYTSKEKLALFGASAGGITVGRAITERPDLFKAAIIYAGCLNTLRSEISPNNNITSEFGTVKDSVEFGYLYEMDTYHHIKDSVKYPSILFSAGLNDARVDPWITAKVVARMQNINENNNLILLRVVDKGHFDYPSVEDVYSFLFWQLGHPDFKLKEMPGFYNNNIK